MRKREDGRLGGARARKRYLLIFFDLETNLRTVMIKSPGVVHPQAGIRTCTDKRVHARSERRREDQSTLISTLLPSGSRTQVESPLPLAPLLTSACEGSSPLRFRVAMTS